MNIKRLFARKLKGILPHLSAEDKKLFEETLIATAKKKGKYDDKAKAQIKQLLKHL